MREIKFRGRDTDGNWHYGDLLRYVRDSYDMIIPAGHANSDDLYDDVVCVDYDTVGQFTGLKDSEGREIYEGDVIKLGNEVYTVSWAKYSACWFVDLKYFGPSLFTQYHAGKSIVIGNVHDNPELLEVEA